MTEIFLEGQIIFIMSGNDFMEWKYVTLIACALRRWKRFPYMEWSIIKVRHGKQLFDIFSTYGPLLQIHALMLHKMPLNEVTDTLGLFQCNDSLTSIRFTII